MSKETWPLLNLPADITADVAAERPLPNGAALGLPGCAVKRRTLRGGLRDGVDLVELDNGRLRVAVLPQRGMGLWKAWLGDWPIGWNSPIRGPVHPRFVPIAEPSGLGWLDGFDELLCRCGLWSNGAPEFDDRGTLIHPLHGRVANLPAHYLAIEADRGAGELSLVGIVDECRFHFHKLRLTSRLTLRPGEAGFRIVDEVTNLSGSPSEMQLLYHINFGSPLLEAGARVVAPVRRVMPRDARAVPGARNWDRYGPPRAGAEEEVYYSQLLAGPDGWTQAVLRNAAGDRGVSIRFSTAELPCFTLWKNSTSPEDGYLTGLEPGVNFPNRRSFESSQSRVRRLAPGETVRFELAIEVRPDAAAVAEAEAAIGALQRSAKPEVCLQPRPGWTEGPG